MTPPQLTEETIRLRAYHLYEERGCEPGHEFEDWLQAQAELTGNKSACSEPETVLFAVDAT